MAFVPDLTPQQEFQELYDYLTGWVKTQERRLQLWEEALKIRDKRLDERERQLDGNHSR